jgi:hypothetical protein
MPGLQNGAVLATGGPGFGYGTPGRSCDGRCELCERFGSGRIRRHLGRADEERAVVSDLARRHRPSIEAEIRLLQIEEMTARLREACPSRAA